MRISISNIAWQNEAEQAVAALLASLGVQGVDVAYTKFWPSPEAASAEAVRDYRAFWAGHGVAIIGMQSLIYGRPDLQLFGSAAERSRMAAYLEAVFRLAGQLGAGPLVFGSPKNRLKGNLSEPAAMATAAEFFAGLAASAAEANVVLCIEPNAAAYGCDFVQTTAPALELVKRVNHPNFRLHLDSGIMTMNGEDVEAALDSAVEHLAHFHVSEPQLAVVGQGTVDHPRFAAALRRIGYQGWVAVEMRSGWQDPDIEAVQAALSYVCEVYGD